MVEKREVRFLRWRRRRGRRRRWRVGAATAAARLRICSRGNAASTPTTASSATCRSDGGAGRQARNGGLDEDRHDLYNVTHGSIKGQLRASARCDRRFETPRFPNNNPRNIEDDRMNARIAESDRGTVARNAGSARRERAREEACRAASRCASRRASIRPRLICIWATRCSSTRCASSRISGTKSRF